MHIFKKINRYYIFFILIITLAAFLRFHRLNETYVFNLDEEYQATYAWRQVLDFHPIWIGLPAAAIEFYLGPYLTYLTAFLLALSKGDPVILGYFASFWGVMTTAAIFLVGRKIFSQTVGVVASLLYASLPLFVFYDQKYWNTMFTSLITLLLLLSLVLIRNSKWWWVFFAGLAGAIFEAHLLPISFLLIGIWYFLKGKYWKDIKLLLICSITFLLFYWPLIVFDINHNFSNLKVFTRIFGHQSQPKALFNPAAKLGTLFDSLGRFWYLKPGSPNADEVNFGCSSLSLSTGFEQIDKYTKRTYSAFWLSLISSSILLFFIVRNLTNRQFPYKLLALFLAVSGFSYLIYSGGPYEYYSLVLLSQFSFVPAIFVSQLNKKVRVVAFSLIFLAICLGIYTVLHTSDEFSLGSKKALIAKAMEIVGDQPFSIEGRGICHNYEGWRYLFKVYGRVPVLSYTDSGLGWLYPDEIGKASAKYTIILSEDRIPLQEDLSGLITIREGGYRAYIKKDENSIFK